MNEGLPYPGLRPFRRDENDIFFGRQQQTDELLNRLDDQHFVAVTGPSGCGKSSLLQAGLISGLETGLIVKAGVHWSIAVLRPADHPMQRLAQSLVESGVLGAQLDGDPNAAGSVYASLRRGPLGLVEVLHRRAVPERTNLLVLVDQFEELFRYRQNRTSGQGFRRPRPSDEADAFVALLLTTAAERDVPVYIAITMRSDYLGDCAVFTGLPEAINASQYLTPRLTRDQCHDAIVGPARLFGGNVESALVNRILNDMGADPDQLPLMQHALMRMWTLAGSPKPVLTPAGYEVIGGLPEALSNHADIALNELDETGRQVAQSLFRSLTDRSTANRDTRRPVTVEAAAAAAGVANEEVIRVADAFRRPDRSFVTPPLSKPLDAKETLDISHESLIAHWHQLTKWVEAEAESVWFFTRLQEQAGLWDRKEGGLWKTPDLEAGLRWREHAKPTPGWAERYGGGYDLAMQFLDASAREQVKEAEARRRAQRTERELRLTRRVGVLAVACALAVSVAAYSLVSARGRDIKRARADASIRESGLQSDRAGALAYLAHALRLDPAREATRGQVMAQLLSRNWALPMGTLRPRELIRAIALSDDGKRLVTVHDGRAQLWETVSPTAWRELGAPITQAGPVAAVALSPDGQHLVVGDTLGLVRLLEAGTGRAIWSRRHGDTVTSVAFSADGKRLASVSAQGTIRVWSTATGDTLGAAFGNGGLVDRAVFSPDGGLILTASRAVQSATQSVRFIASRWDVTTGQPFGHPLRWSNPPLVAATFGGEERDVVGAFERYPFGRVNPAGRVERLSPYIAKVKTAAVSAGGRWVATVSGDGVVDVWDAATGRAVVEPLGLTGIGAVAVSADGRWIATAFPDSTLRVWNVSGGRAITPSLPHRDEVYTAAFDPEGTHLVTASRDSSARVWDARTGELMRSLPHSGPVSSAGFNDDGTRLVTASESTAQVWDTKTWQVKEVLHDGEFRFAAFAPSGRRVVTVSEGTVRIWDSAGTKVMTRDYRDQVQSAAISPDGRMVLIVIVDNAEVREVATQQLLHSLRHQGKVASGGFSADGRWILTASWDSTVRIWNAATGQEGPALRHQGPLQFAAFSRDGRRIVTTSEDGSVRVFDAATRSIIAQLLDARAYSAVFSPDGRRIVIASVVDRAAWVWDIPSGESNEAETLARLAEIIAGKRVDLEGALTTLSDPVAEFERLRLAAANSPFTQWFMADRCDRLISPLSGITMREYVARPGITPPTLQAMWCSSVKDATH